MNADWLAAGANGTLVLGALMLMIDWTRRHATGIALVLIIGGYTTFIILTAIYR